jgi:diaminopimelate decarboxylase
MKANSNQAVLKTLAKLGAGADVVSEGELRRALAAGIPPKASCSRASARRSREMDFALEPASTASTSRASPSSSVCPRRRRASARRYPSASTRMSMPTHAKISTGKKENKFGISFARAHEVYARRRSCRASKATGIDMHIGSQITDMQPFDDAFALLRELVERCAPTATSSSMSMSAAASASPIKLDNDPPPESEAYAEIVKKPAQAARLLQGASSRAG